MSNEDDPGGKPKRLSAEIEALLATVSAHREAERRRRQGRRGARPPREKERRTFRLGDRVRIRSGPFASFTGRIEGINQAKALLKVVVELFGRARPIRLEFSEVEKISFAGGPDSD